jgi:cell wall-associated NlpC family hydrolase
MGRFQEDPEAVERLRAELERWRGTPFRHRAAVCGRGVDCVHLAVRVIETVFPDLAPVAIPTYEYGWSRAKDADPERMVKELERMFPTARVDRPADGDLLCYRFFNAESHVGILLDDQAWQSMTGQGVTRISYQDRRINRRVGTILRVV